MWVPLGSVAGADVTASVTLSVDVSAGVTSVLLVGSLVGSFEPQAARLKAMEAAGDFAVLVPVVDKALETPEQEELFINAYNHTARRVKDCISVAGFELPAQLKDKAAFMETLAIKHAQYVYFTKAENPLSDDIVVY